MKFVRSPMVTSRTIVALLLQLILVSNIRVKSSCFEEDCADPAIKVINNSSRECVTCFQCSPCPEGQKLSVACPSTVVEGTGIYCMVPAGPSGVSSTRASAYVTDVFFTLLASPSAISGYSSSTEDKQITETRVTRHIHNHDQPSVSATATSSTGSHSSITVAVLATMESGQDSYVTIATLSSCGVALLMFTILAVLFILKKRRSISLRFPCNDNKKVRPNLTSDSGDNELCSVLLCPENHTASYINQKRKDTDQQDSTCQENDQPLLHDATFSAEETIPSSLDNYCGLGEDQQRAVNEGATAVDSAGSSQDPTLPVSPEKPSSLVKDLKPDTCITPNVNINLIQTCGEEQKPDHYTDSHELEPSPRTGNQLSVSVHHSSTSSSFNIVSHPGLAPTSSSVARKISGLHSPVQFNMVFPPHYPVLPDQYHGIWTGGESKLNKESSTNWPKLSQSERHHTKFSQIPFPLLNKICHYLDIIRTDGKDVRMVADKLGMMPRDFEAIEHAAIRHKDSTTYVVLKEGFLTRKTDATVNDFVVIMKDIGRDDIINLINDYKGE